MEIVIDHLQYLLYSIEQTYERCGLRNSYIMNMSEAVTALQTLLSTNGEKIITVCFVKFIYQITFYIGY